MSHFQSVHFLPRSYPTIFPFHALVCPRLRKVRFCSASDGSFPPSSADLPQDCNPHLQGFPPHFHKNLQTPAP